MFEEEQVSPDYFSREGDTEYAGKHLLIDTWGVEDLDNPAKLEKTIRVAVEKSGATLLHYHSHQFSPSGGLSATAILAESHLNAHTWPERKFAAFDVFMCGGANPEAVIDVIKTQLKPAKLNVEINLRGKQNILWGSND